MREPTVVGAFIRNERNHVYAQRRTQSRRLLPGIWDVVGGHIEAGETPEEALAREILEETGWPLRHVEAMIADWEWEHAGVVRRELDYLVEVDGDLAAPTLEEGKHDAFAWVGPDNLELMMKDRTDGDRRLRDLVAKAARIRLTERLRLEPTNPEHADDLWRLHQDNAVAEWYAGTWSAEAAHRTAREWARAWDADGVHKWIAYDRVSGELVGRGGLSSTQVDGADHLELGWALLGERWGQGYATEIGQAGLAFAFGDLGAKTVVAFTERHNARSRAVMERLGMRFVREIIRHGLVEGRAGVHDDAPFALYALDRSDPVG
ncbi:GNAT family N-acetyltransferase [Actinopolymorpha alba]|uniref:GNAT family N-acetyltransferase n=1 Tax=Actinopolymorpha alba TaxID=533267 RepID=UPI0003688A35|nr:GNAT family N-acetyltransferase [Actinopolymorpha alba]